MLVNQIFQDFQNEQLCPQSFNPSEASVHVACCLNQPEEPSRRVLVSTEPNNPKIEVSIEATYELFEGDFHYCVIQVGQIKREEVAEKLQLLVSRAAEMAMAWQPNFATIQDQAFLPS